MWIAAGPDGALWFTNPGRPSAGEDSIGRITTSGTVTIYPVAPFSYPDEITAGPDGALWFTDGEAIGRITTSVTPEIYTVTPRSGAVGTQVTITGRNLAPATQVTLHGTPATVISGTATQVVTTVPAGATTGRFAIATPAGTVEKNGWFTVK